MKKALVLLCYLLVLTTLNTQSNIETKSEKEIKKTAKGIGATKKIIIASIGVCTLGGAVAYYALRPKGKSSQSIFAQPPVDPALPRERAAFTEIALHPTPQLTPRQKTVRVIRWVSAKVFDLTPIWARLPVSAGYDLTISKKISITRFLYNRGMDLIAPVYRFPVGLAFDGAKLTKKIADGKSIWDE